MPARHFRARGTRYQRALNSRTSPQFLKIGDFGERGGSKRERERSERARGGREREREERARERGGASERERGGASERERRARASDQSSPSMTQLQCDSPTPPTKKWASNEDWKNAQLECFQTFVLEVLQFIAWYCNLLLEVLQFIYSKRLGIIDCIL